MTGKALSSGTAAQIVFGVFFLLLVLRGGGCFGDVGR